MAPTSLDFVDSTQATLAPEKLAAECANDDWNAKTPDATGRTRQACVEPMQFTSAGWQRGCCVVGLATNRSRINRPCMQVPTNQRRRSGRRITWKLPAVRGRGPRAYSRKNPPLRNERHSSEVASGLWCRSCGNRVRSTMRAEIVCFVRRTTDLWPLAARPARCSGT